MFKVKDQKVYIVYAFNIVIALAYYISNLDAHYSELSSDLQNIVPVAQKFDDPSLFKKDLYLDNLDNVRYYTPFYVQPLRAISKFTNKNYVQAINVLGLICHLLFGILWFFLIFKFSNNFWLSLLISVLVRGIVWLPGLEIWGISDLWSIMPRTVYITLMPIPFIVLSNKKTALFFASFLMGFVFNFHPITGLGGLLLFAAFLLLYVLIYKKYEHLNSKTILGVLILLVLGMLPFVLTYFGKTSSQVNYNLNDYTIAFNRRIPAYFSDPVYFVKQWFKVQNLIYFIPVFLYLWLVKANDKAFKKAKLLFGLLVILIAIPLLSIPVENLINKWFNLNLRLSFQLVRMQKVAILPGVFAIVFLLNLVLQKYEKIKSFLPFVFCGYLLVLVFSHNKYFDAIPYVGDDICRSVLPSNLAVFSAKNKKSDKDYMAEYIKANTEKKALLCASDGFFRGSALRAVVLDSKGASMIIEGNPIKFIEWSKQQEKAMNMNSAEDVVVYLKSLGVNYFITRGRVNNAILEHEQGRIKLYNLN